MYKDKLGEAQQTKKLYSNYIIWKDTLKLCNKS